MNLRWIVWLLGGLAVVAQPLAAQQHRIRFGTADAPYSEAFEAIALEYEKLHPDVDVVIQIVPADGYATWLRTAVAGGEQTSPDIYAFNYARTYYESGRAITLNAYLDQTNPYTARPWRESFHTQHLEMLRVVNDYPAIPLNFIEIAVMYNKDLFAKAGVDGPPRTWDEMIAACEKLRASGTIPMAMAADAESTWSMAFGWLVRVISDSYNHDRLEFVRARPGDFAYVPETDGAYVPDKANPMADLRVNLPMERHLQGLLDGDMAVDTPAMRAMYTRLKDFSRHWQRGYGGTSFTSCYQLFMTQRAAMIMHHSGAVLGVKYDLEQLEPRNQFDWGVFPVPTIENDPFAQIPLRGVGAPIPQYGVLRKSREQNDRVVDFLMYMTTPQSGRRILEVMVEKKRAIVGPFAIRDVPLPPGLDDKFAPFLGRGCDRMSMRGLFDEQQATWRWVILTQDYMGGALSLDDFLEQYQRTTIEAIPRIIRANDLDMNPATRDNNGALLVEIEGALKALADKPAAQASADALRDAAHDELRSFGFRVVKSPATGVDLLVERTIPVVIAATAADYAGLERDAADLAKANNYQYLVVVELGAKPARVRVFNYRPTVDAVLGRIAGRRYTNAQLQDIFVD